MRKMRRHVILAAALAELEGVERLRQHFHGRLAVGWKFARICDIRRFPYNATAKAIGYDMKRRGWIAELSLKKPPKPPPSPPDGAWRDAKGHWHIPARAVGRSVRFYCPACKKEHIHGDDGQAITHRTSHCFLEESPLHSGKASKGYHLHIDGRI